MSNVDTINRLAKDIAERFGSDINAASEQASCEFNQLYTNILIEVDRTFGNNRDYYEFCEVISDTFTKVMEKYDPQYDFWNFFVSSLKKKALSRIDKRNREKYEKTKSDDGEKSIQNVRKRESCACRLLSRAESGLFKEKDVQLHAAVFYRSGGF